MFPGRFHGIIYLSESEYTEKEISEKMHIYICSDGLV